MKVNSTSRGWVVLDHPFSKIHKDDNSEINDSEFFDEMNLSYFTLTENPVESDELKRLGLPVSFGNRKKDKKKKDKEKHDENDKEKHNENDKEKHNENDKEKDNEIKDDEIMAKYWHQRYQLFSLFDKGILLDREGWFSVTPETIAAEIAEACRCDIIIDAFCGVGGNAIQFAQTCNLVIAIDNNPTRLKMAKHNARIYGVEDRILFLLGDFFDFAGSGAFNRLKPDVVFLSPPWGGPAYLSRETYDLSLMMPGKGALEILLAAQKITQNIAFFIPRNSDLQQIKDWNIPCRVQSNWISGNNDNVKNPRKRKRLSHQRRLKALTVFFGPFLLEENDAYWNQFLQQEQDNQDEENLQAEDE